MPEVTAALVEIKASAVARLPSGISKLTSPLPKAAQSGPPTPIRVA